MLRFYAEKFLAIGEYLSQMEMALLNKTIGPPPETVVEDLKTKLRKAKNLCQSLDLKWTIKQIDRTTQQISANWPEEAATLLADCRVRLREELEDCVFLKIDASKISYAAADWLLDTPIESIFPSTIKEFQRAGRCFALDENTACMFHLMRVVDFGLRSVATRLGIEYSARAWDGIGKAIVRKMEDKYHDKTMDWKATEPIYAEVLTDIQAISRGHRNPVLHELEKTYEEKEAQYMLTVVEGFMTHLAANGFKE
jgi:hypothetical protein